jgi:hypothetical protein
MTNNIKDILTKDYGYILQDIIRTYFNNDYREQIITYHRIIYIYYILLTYILKVNLEKNQIKNIFFEYYDTTVVIEEKNKSIIKKNIEIHFDNLYKTIFIDNNIYFSVYFNNLIKYFLPVPYELILYSPILTYRTNVNTIYKKNSIDYLDTIKHIDSLEQKNYVAKKNIDLKDNEIDIHIPMKYFDDQLFNKDHIFYLADNMNLYIVSSINNSKMQVLYSRKLVAYNQFKFQQGVCLELLSPEWNKIDKLIDVDITKVCYISVCRKITKEILFDVFPKMTIDTENFKYIYHNTGLTNETLYEKYLDYPTFFFMTPLSNIGKYFKDRKCILYKIKKDIPDILDITRSIATDNTFTNKKKVIDQENKKWISYDNPKTIEFYDNGIIPTHYSHNYACVTHLNNNKQINEFRQERPYCDVHNKLYYSGRRKLHEILFKTRKYDASKIWVYEFMTTMYSQMGYKVDTLNYLYHPKSDLKILTSSYDILILKDLGINGFFSTDFDVAYKTGGEVMLTYPKEFIDIFKISNKICNDKHAFDSCDKKLCRIENTEDNAFVMLLMGNSQYFIGALITGYSLQQTNTIYDVVILVTPDVPEYQKQILRKVYDHVIDIDYAIVDKKIIKDYDNNRFRDVFTKLKLFTLIQYKKIIIMDIDMLVQKNMDHLFELKAPAACLRSHDLAHGEKINKNLIVDVDNKLIGGINGGLMLFEPNMKEYDAMIEDLQDAGNRVFKYIEQDYLSLRYADKWTNISFLYNFQFGLTDRAKKYKNSDVYNLHYSSHIKPWQLIYETKYMERKIDDYNTNYYNIWMSLYKNIKKMFNIEPVYLEYTYNLDNYVKKSVNSVILSHKYEIIGSYKYAKYITDIDITNYIMTEKDIYTELKNKILKLPKNIKFVNITIDTYFNLQEYLEVSMTNKIPIIKKFKEKELIEQINKMDLDLYTFNDVMSKLKKDPIEAYYAIKQLNKKKLFLKDIMNTNYNIKLENYPVIHYCMYYDNQYIYVDVALMDNDKQSKFVRTELDNILPFYLKEYYYVLSAIKKYFKNMKDEKNVDNINNLINFKYGMFKQLMMNLFYLYYLSRFEILNKNEFVNYYSLLLDNITKTTYNSSNRNHLLDRMNNNLNSIINDYILHTDISIYTHVQELRNDVFVWLNMEFKDHVKYYLELLKDKNIKVEYEYLLK